jgi:hypothetical protein
VKSDAAARRLPYLERMPDQEVFTLEEVNAKIPQLREMVGEQLAQRATIQERLSSLGELTEEIPDDFAAQPGDSSEVRALKAELAMLVAAYHRGWQAVEALGAVVKDPRVGLIDFYGRVDGKLVWLCWKYGEEEVAYYHALDEGFSGRKAIGQSLRLRLLN